MTASQPKKLTRTQAPKAPPPEPGASEPSLRDIAQGILDRKARPRAADLRRLAEAVLAGESKGDKKKKKEKAAGKKSEGKRRKLTKIAGQKKKQAK